MGQIILFEHIDTIIIVFIYHNHRKIVKNKQKLRMGYELVDCQVQNPHLQSLGAFNMSRHAFIQRLDELLLK
jgi:hypothetical protein